MGCSRYSSSNAMRSATTVSRSADVARRTVTVTPLPHLAAEQIVGPASRLGRGASILPGFAARDALARHERFEHQLARRHGLRRVIVGGETDAMHDAQQSGHDLEPAIHELR